MTPGLSWYKTALSSSGRGRGGTKYSFDVVGDTSLGPYRGQTGSVASLSNQAQIWPRGGRTHKYRQTQTKTNTWEWLVVGTEEVSGIVYSCLNSPPTLSLVLLHTGVLSFKQFGSHVLFSVLLRQLDPNKNQNFITNLGPASCSLFACPLLPPCWDKIGLLSRWEEARRAPPHLNFLRFLSFQQGPASFLQKLPSHSDLDTLVECPPRQMTKTKVRNMREHMEEICKKDRFPSCKTFRLILTQTQTHTSVFLASETEFVTPRRPTWIFALFVSECATSF